MSQRFLAVLLVSLSLVLTLTRPARASNPTLAVGIVTGAPGTTANLPVEFTPGTTGISAIQFDLTLPSTLVWVSSTAGAAATAADNEVQGAVTSGVARTLIFGLNQTTIGAGVIATVQLTIDPSAPPGPIPVPISNVVASDPNGVAVTADGTDGTVTVGDADGGEVSDAAPEDATSLTDGAADAGSSDSASTDAALTDAVSPATDAPAGSPDSSITDAASPKDASSTSSDAALAGSDASGPAASGSSKSSGCGCRQAASPADAYGAYALAIAAGLAGLRRRRRGGAGARTSRSAERASRRTTFDDDRLSCRL